MLPVTQKPTALRDTWRPNDTSSAKARWRRRLRRYGSATAVALLGVLLLWLLFAPFQHPTTWLLELSGDSYELGQAPPLDFATRDIASVGSPLIGRAKAEGKTDGLGPLVQTHVLRTREDLDQLIAALNNLPAKPSDAILIYVAAHAVSREGQPVLLCQNFTPTNAEQGSYPLASLLQQLRLSPAGLKLLMLEQGRLDFDVRLGVIVNEFPRLLEREVTRLGDPTIWVLASHSPLERSLTDYRAQQSLFGGAVARALSGAADANGDRFLSLDELSRYVRSDVAQRAHAITGGRLQQTPMLLAGSPVEMRRAAGRLLLTVPSATMQKLTAVAREAAETATSDAAGQMAATVEEKAGDKLSDAKRALGAEESADGGGAKRLPDASAKTGSSATTDFPARDATLEQLLHFGWAQTAASERNTKPTGLARADVPAAWRAWKERLLSRDRLRRSGDTYDQAAAAAALRQDLALLFAPDQSLLRPPPEPALRLLRRDAASNVVDWTKLPSWALAEREAPAAGQTPPSAIAKRFAELDQLLSGDDPEKFEELRKQPWPEGSRNYVEIRDLLTLVERRALAWPMLQRWWSTTRLAQRLAAEPRVAEPWAVEHWQRAESWMLAARREISDQIGVGWATRAEAMLRRAELEYKTLDREVRERNAHEALAERLLIAAPEMVRWRQLVAGDETVGPAFDDLAELLSTLATFVTVREQAAPAKEQIAELYSRLQELERRVVRPLQANQLEKLLADAASSVARNRLELVLQTWLVEPEMRELIQATLASVPRNRAADDTVRLTSGAEPDTRLLTPNDWQQASESLRLSRLLAQLARIDGEDDAEALQLEAVWQKHFEDSGQPNKANEVATSDQIWDAYRAYGDALASFYQRRVERLHAELARHSDFRDPTRREQERAAVRGLHRAAMLLDARDIDQLGDDQPAAVLRRAADYDLLRSHLEQALAARQDAPPQERPLWETLAERYRAVANGVPQQPPLPTVTEPRLVWDGPTSLSLATEPRREVTLTLVYRGAAPAKTWLSLHYDQELLDVRVLGERTPADEGKLRAALTDDRLPYPIRPDELGEPAFAELVPGRPFSIKLALLRRPVPGRQSTVVIKALSNYEIVRHEIAVQFPSLDTITLVPAGPDGSWSSAPDGVVLHPLPSHRQDYRLQLANFGVTDRVIDVDVFAPKERIPGESAEEFLAIPVPDLLGMPSLGPPIIRREGWTLPANRTPATLLPSAPLGDEPSEDEAAEKLADAPAAASEEPPGLSIRHGLIVVVRDRQSGETLVRRMLFRPQRPRRYLNVDVAYRRDLERIELRVRPRDPRIVPAKGIQVHATFPQPLPKNTEAELDGIVQAPDYEARLHIAAPADPQRIQTIYLNVDGFPRAFIFKVPCGATAMAIPEAQDVLGIRLLEPVDGTSFKVPTATVPVVAEVDAPPGAFEGTQDLVEIGVDRRRDRELVDDPLLRVQTDRQVDVALHRWTASGLLTVTATAHDFRVAIPTSSVRSVRAELLGRVVVGRETRWSTPVGVVFDGDKPAIKKVELGSARVAPIGGEFEVHVWATDDELSGVEKVEVGFDTDRKGKFGAEPPAVARPTPGGAWIAKLPIDLPAAGPVTILARATDRVGNTSDFSKTTATVITAEEAESAKKNVTNRVLGVVRLGAVPLPKATVELFDAKRKFVEEAEVDAQGRFEFPKVAPGKYQLVARGLAKNKPRQAKVDITVAAPPAPPVETELQTDR